jgi:flagellar hook-length control protein FliK
MNCTGLETSTAMTGLGIGSTGAPGAALPEGSADAAGTGFARLLAAQRKAEDAAAEAVPAATSASHGSTGSSTPGLAMTHAINTALTPATPQATAAEGELLGTAATQARTAGLGFSSHLHGATAAAAAALGVLAGRPAGQEAHPTTRLPAAEAGSTETATLTTLAVAGGAHGTAHGTTEAGEDVPRAGTHAAAQGVITNPAPLQALLASLTAAAQAGVSTLALTADPAQRGHAAGGHVLGTTPPRGAPTRTAALAQATRTLATTEAEPDAAAAAELATSVMADARSTPLPTRAVRPVGERDAQSSLGLAGQGVAVDGSTAASRAQDASTLGPSKALLQTLEQLAIHWEEGGSGGARTAQVNVRLDPAGWGSVELGVRMQSGVVQLVVRCDNDRTAKALRGEVGALRKALAGSGLELERCDVETLPEGIGAGQNQGDATDGSSGGAFDERGPY